MSAMPHKKGDCLRSSATQRGLTLVELLLSILLSAVALVLIGEGVRVVAGSWNIKNQQLQHREQLNRGLAVLRRDIESVRRIGAVAGDGVRYIFDGGANSITFVAATRLQGRGHTLAYVNYHIERDGAVVRIVRQTAPLIAGTLAISAPTDQRTVVLTGLAKAQFGYAGAALNASWLNRWEDRATIPQHVRLQVVTVEGRHLPDIVMAIATNTEQECVTTKAAPCSLSLAVTRVAGREQASERTPPR